MKTLINGTAHDITQGKTLINGVAYTITQGKTLVDGVAYDIGGSQAIAVTITGEGSDTGCWVAFNQLDEPIFEEQYWTAATGIEVEAGYRCWFMIQGGRSPYVGYVYVDGETIASVTSSAGELFKWEVPEGIATITINLAKRKVGSGNTITVTTA